MPCQQKGGPHIFDNLHTFLSEENSIFPQIGTYSSETAGKDTLLSQAGEKAGYKAWTL